MFISDVYKWCVLKFGWRFIVAIRELKEYENPPTFHDKQAIT